MIITVKTKHLNLRKGIYHFRMRVPSDCVDAIGSKEKSESLHTADPVEAQHQANKLARELKAKCKKIRNKKLKLAKPQSLKKPDTAATIVDDFRTDMVQRAEESLIVIFAENDEEKLRQLSIEYYSEMEKLRNPESHVSLAIPELGFEEPWSAHKNKQIDRQLRRVVIETLQKMRVAIDEELEEPFSEKYDAELLGDAFDCSTHPVPQAGPALNGTESAEEHDIIQVTDLLLMATKRVKRGADSIRADAHALKEWCGKSDITLYTKKDLVDYVQNCLPYIPHHRATKNAYKGLSLRECIKSSLEIYEPISHRTCKNRLINLSTIFNYAKDQLGIVSINPASKIEIPEVRITEQLPRGLTADELKDLWNAIQVVPNNYPARPSFYWVPILCLYHGFRLNEAASLFLKDVYTDADGIWVFDINADGPNKSVKTDSSIRVIPIHPYILNSLKFKDYVNRAKEAASEGLLFPELTYSGGHGYGRKISNWFPKWKKSWLPEESMHKHIHDLRHTFIQQAQNQAKMTDRCCQEITGHAVEGISAVHLGYSGRLKPKAILEELKELRYGWEDEPLPVIEPLPKKAPKKKKRRRKKRKTATKKDVSN